MSHPAITHTPFSGFAPSAGGIAVPYKGFSHVDHRPFRTKVIAKTAVPTAFGATAKSSDIRFAISASECPGTLDRVYLHLNVTSDASGLLLGGRVLTDVQIKINGNILAPPMGPDIMQLFAYGFQKEDEILHTADTCGITSAGAGVAIDTAATDHMIDITSVLKPLQLYVPALRGADPIHIQFKVNSVNDCLTTGKTVTINTLELVVCGHVSPDDTVKHHQFDSGVSCPYLAPRELSAITLASGAVTKARLNMTVDGKVPFLTGYAKDVSADINQIADNCSALSSYLVYSSGGSPLYSESSDVKTVGEHKLDVAKTMADDGFYYRVSTKNTLFIPLGFSGRIRDSIEHGVHSGAHSCDGNELVTLTSSDTSADSLVLIEWVWHVADFRKGLCYQAERA
jgi:hypothetical protein